MKLLLIITTCLLVAAIVAFLLSRHSRSDQDKLQQADQPKSISDYPRHKENPTNLFFEDYVLDVIGQLPAERSRSTQEINLQNVFNTKASNWKEVVEEALHLSDTIEVAILDLWYRNREIGRQQEMEYNPRQFAMDFVDHYFEKDSKVDVWDPGALDAAKERIKRYQAQEE